MCIFSHFSAYEALIAKQPCVASHSAVRASEAPDEPRQPDRGARARCRTRSVPGAGPKPKDLPQSGPLALRGSAASWQALAGFVASPGLFSHCTRPISTLEPRTCIFGKFSLPYYGPYHVHVFDRRRPSCKSNQCMHRAQTCSRTGLRPMHDRPVAVSQAAAGWLSRSERGWLLAAAAVALRLGCGTD